MNIKYSEISMSVPGPERINSRNVWELIKVTNPAMVQMTNINMTAGTMNNMMI
jgi:hypothetical protein